MPEGPLQGNNGHNGQQNGRHHGEPLKIAVLASGKGSNLVRIHREILARELPAHIVLVFSDKPDSGAVKYAREHEISCETLRAAEFPARGAFDEAVAGLIEASGAELVVMAGYMRLVSDDFIARFKGRIVNVHPSLLPAFKGAHAISDALEYGVKLVGVTVHFVTEEMDAGPIILQQAVEVAPNDTREDVMHKVHAAEHNLYPAALKLYAQGRLRVEGRIVHIS